MLFMSHWQVDLRQSGVVGEVSRETRVLGLTCAGCPGWMGW